jgi:hypothetical protein
MRFNHLKDFSYPAVRANIQADIGLDIGANC